MAWIVRVLFGLKVLVEPDGVNEHSASSLRFFYVLIFQIEGLLINLILTI